MENRNHHYSQWKNQGKAKEMENDELNMASKFNDFRHGSIRTSERTEQARITTGEGEADASAVRSRWNLGTGRLAQQRFRHAVACSTWILQPT